MRILLTGSTGYIGRRLLPLLVEAGHEVICVCRDPRRFDFEDFDYSFLDSVTVVKGDLLNADSLENIPKDFDVAYYLVHSMSNSFDDFEKMEKTAAINFRDFIKTTECQQIIYLGGIANCKKLSRHLQSRVEVEHILGETQSALTVLRAAIIIGSGGASFEIIRDLVEKLPVMVAPKWLLTKCQPIAIRNVMDYLMGVMLKEEAYNKVFDIGGKDVLNYKDMLLQFAKVRGLQRRILVVPVFTPNLSSYWLYFVTSTTYSLARSLVESMGNEVVCNDSEIQKIVPVKLLTYEEALESAFQKIAQNEVVSSWKESIIGPIREDFLDMIQVPKYGCFVDFRKFQIQRPVDEVLDNVWAIGGERGWYYGTWLWKIRGFMDKMVGGVGLRRGRRSQYDLKTGEALDFWRVILADKKHKRLLLFAEMKLPGEAWLEFRVKNKDGKQWLEQKATFRPLGVWGRLYWYLVFPLHMFVFPGMAKNILAYQDSHHVKKRLKVT
ncbi:SDR family oxidoreductase [Flammeovirga aprica]|uniref:SDR family oxidoreductase n=1 Tax=Flammeovirga aprica JL-4 TaxID=694437 RepID=A0A7X9RSN4_9BACT|nr:SDR family oxidoreductase [Flammeovirga aprica]NME67306.1 SDR family oxidoreductase [Flammeovirga aprica JL-4]